MKSLYKSLTFISIIITIFLFKFRLYWSEPLDEIERLWREKRNETKEKTIISYSTSLWFLSRIDYMVTPHWDQSNMVVDSPAFTWWMSVHEDRDVDTPMQEIFLAGVPSRIDEQHTPNQIVRCAVVGNSDNVLQHTYGEFIDQHTYVMRFNKAVTKNFEKHVGSRTTHHFSYPESSHDYFSNETAFVLVPFLTRDLWWLAGALRGHYNNSEYDKEVPSKLTCDKSKVRILHPTFLRYIHVNWLEEHMAASTGFIGLIYALHMCDHVNVFGFKQNDKGQWLHYFESNETFSGNHYEHDDAREKATMKMLHVEGAYVCMYSLLVQG